MQRLTLDKILKSTVKNARDPLFYFTNLIKYSKLNMGGDYWRLDTSVASEIMARINPESALFIDKYLGQSGSIEKKIIFHGVEYREGNFDNYVVSKPLLEVLGKVRVDMPVSQIKLGVNSYFELGGYKGFEFALISTYIKPAGLTLGGVQLKISAYNDTTGKVAYWGIDLGEDTLEKCLAKVNAFYGQEWDLATVEAPDDIFHTFANLLIYISNPTDEFKKEFNSFSSNNKKCQKEKLEYTQKPFIRIGYDATFLRLVTETEFGVRGHFRWQPFGVGRVQRKLIFIDPFTKTQKKFIEVDKDYIPVD
jgi:hypothetical protein